MKFLLTNDDGIEAPGLAMLEQALSGLGKVVVASDKLHRGLPPPITPPCPAHPGLATLTPPEHSQSPHPHYSMKPGVNSKLPRVKYNSEAKNDSG